MFSSLDAQFVLATQHFFFSISGGQELAIFFAKWLILANVPLAFIFWISKQEKLRDAFFAACLSLVLGLGFTSFIAALIQRPRPFLVETGVLLLVSPPLKTSFPSGHTAAAVALACAFLFGDKRLGGISLAIAALVALGRVAVGVHYPTDILGGIVVGLASSLLARAGYRAFRRRAT